MENWSFWRLEGKEGVYQIQVSSNKVYHSFNSMTAEPSS
jgi:hypothetical protein